MQQCSILYVGPSSSGASARAAGLRAMGFKVDESKDLPGDEAVSKYHAVIVSASGRNLAMVAATVRAKRHFDRRILLALVAEEMPDRDRRDAVLSGFDHTLADTCSVRDIAATVVRLLRPYPEYRCLLRLPGGRRKAA